MIYRKRTKNRIQKKEAIGIMGGTFDPIHVGHLFVAEEAQHQFCLDKVLFVPSKVPPHKQARKDITHPELRFSMALIATISHPKFFVSRIEIDREGPSYTYDTLQLLRQECPEAKFFFITGLDAVMEIVTWYKAQEVMENCQFIAASRPGFDSKQVESGLNDYARKVHFMEIPALSISSSDIRNRVRSGRPIKYLVPEGVEQFIYKNGLYRSNR